MKKLTIALVLVVLFCSSCSNLMSGEFEFINDSSYTIAIEPNGQDWLGFLLTPHTTRTLRISDTRIYFLYTPSNYVWCDVSIPGEVLFTDKF